MNKFQRLSLMLCIGGAIFTSCSDNIDVAAINETTYTSNENTLAFISDKYGNSVADSLNFADVDSTNLYVELSQAAAENTSITLNYDETVLTEYNKTKGTVYKALPQKLLTMSSEVTIAKGNSKSTAALVKYTTAKALDSLGTYVVPISIKTKSGNVKLSESKSKFLLFLKDLSKLPNCNKSTGIKIISCMEVNDTNPLNNLCFTLKKSGKPLIDMVILFSGNINYNSQTGRVYNYNNENVQHLLDYKEKYLKPLQDRGMKIILGILGNHDRAGVANLSKPAAQQFASELKAVVEAYNLDGVFFDDEWSNYGNYPGFVPPSSQAASVLCYETKKAMPNKLVTVYAYSTTRTIYPVEGHSVKDFIDYGIADYGTTADYDELPDSRLAMYSQEYSRGYIANVSQLQEIREKGYAHMIFGMDPNRSSFNRQLNSMKNIAKYLFDDELVYDGKPYSKDW